MEDRIQILAHTDYFTNLAQSMTLLLNGVLKDSASLFRRSPQVVFGSPLSAASQDFHLYIVGKSGLDQEKGTFLCESAQDKFVVFRNPSRMTISFSLVGTAVPSAIALRAYDKLCAFFFDSRTIDPFLPEGFKAFPALFDRMRAHKADIRIQSREPNTTRGEEFRFDFDYMALYHSGNPLREEHKTKQRVIDINDGTERSVL